MMHIMCVKIMDEVKNANFSFNKKSYVDALLQKGRVG